MEEKELLMRHQNQKDSRISSENGARYFSEANHRLGCFLVRSFKDVKDDSKKEGFTVSLLQSLPAEDQHVFEWLVNELIGYSLWREFDSKLAKAPPLF